MSAGVEPRVRAAEQPRHLRPRHPPEPPQAPAVERDRELLADGQGRLSSDGAEAGRVAGRHAERASAEADAVDHALGGGLALGGGP